MRAPPPEPEHRPLSALFLAGIAPPAMGRRPPALERRRAPGFRGGILEPGRAARQRRPGRHGPPCPGARPAPPRVQLKNFLMANNLLADRQRAALTELRRLAVTRARAEVETEAAFKVRNEA